MNPDYPTWEQYRLHLVSELDRMVTAVDRLTERMDHMENALIANAAAAEQKAKTSATLWGVVGAFSVEVLRVIGEAIFRHS